MIVIEELLQEELIVMDMKAKDSNEAIGKLAQVLYKNAFVKESYIKAVQDREKTFPTGLPTEGVGVAIPHTDSIHVSRAAISVGILKNPVKFNMMGYSKGDVDVEIIFMLAIKDPTEQPQVLENLINLIQDHRTLLQIKKSKSRSEIIGLIKETLVCTSS